MTLLFDLLPDDILDKCCTYIYYPQSKFLLNDIENLYIKNTLLKLDEITLSNIYYNLVKKWHLIYVPSMFHEFQTDFDNISLLISTYDSLDERIILWYDQILDLIDIKSIKFDLDLDLEYKTKKLSKKNLYDFI